MFLHCLQSPPAFETTCDHHHHCSDSQVQLLNSKPARPAQRAPQPPGHQHHPQPHDAEMAAETKRRLRRKPSGPTGSAAEISARRAAEYAAEVRLLAFFAWPPTSTSINTGLLQVVLCHPARHCMASAMIALQLLF